MENKTWIEKPDGLYKVFVFRSFIDAITFMHNCSQMIEVMDHHPEWTNIYDQVHVCLRTHDAGNMVTEKDRKLAEILDAVAGQMMDFH